MGTPNLSKELRHEQILAAAVNIARADGYSKVTRANVADVAGVSTGQVNSIFGTMDALRAQVIKYAINALDDSMFNNEPLDDRMLAILAQGLAAGWPVARDAPQKIKNKALVLLC